MNTQDFEYYRIGRENNENYPLLASVENGAYQYETGIVENPQTIKYLLRKSGTKRYTIVDFHKSPYSVISQKIYDVLAGMNLEGVQFIPATITGKKNEIYEGYFYLHICNFLPAMDRERSVYKWMKTANVANPIDKLVLDHKLLENIPLEKRLVFRMQENDLYELFHKSVVDAIMATNPQGIRFSKINNNFNTD